MLTKITLDNFKSFKNTETIDLMKTSYTGDIIMEGMIHIE